MRLVDVYTEPRATAVLWQLMAERTPEVNISHQGMPTLDHHLAFIAKRPYAHWYLLDVGDGDFVGAVYLTHAREIGVFVLQRFRGNGFGRIGVQMLMQAHPGRFLANINPRNERSLRLFRELGFGEPMQVTLERGAA